MSRRSDTPASRSLTAPPLHAARLAPESGSSATGAPGAADDSHAADEQRASGPSAEPAPDAAARRHCVVTYHYVRPSNSDGVTGLSPHAFEAQLRLIAQRYRFVTAEEFVAEHRAQDNLALVTFDDAVRDQYEYAAPILERLRIPAVFYAPMRPFSDEADRWCTQHLLHALAENLGYEELERRVRNEIGTPEIDEEAMHRIYHYEVPRKRRLKYLMAFTLPAQQAAEVLGSVNKSVGLSSDEWFMTAEQLGELQSAGHALGGHGFDHLPYTAIDADAQRRDMHRAAELMNRLFGKRPRTLAWPFGRTNASAEALAREAGFVHTFTTAARIDAMDLDAFLERDPCPP